jgi:hypothetical protein
MQCTRATTRQHHRCSHPLWCRRRRRRGAAKAMNLTPTSIEYQETDTSPAARTCGLHASTACACHEEASRRVDTQLGWPPQASRALWVPRSCAWLCCRCAAMLLLLLLPLRCCRRCFCCRRCRRCCCRCCRCFCCCFCCCRALLPLPFPLLQWPLPLLPSATSTAAGCSCLLWYCLPTNQCRQSKPARRRQPRAPGGRLITSSGRRCALRA